MLYALCLFLFHVHGKNIEPLKSPIISPTMSGYKFRDVPHKVGTWGGFRKMGFPMLSDDSVMA